jgi:hypothetical protein
MSKVDRAERRRYYPIWKQIKESTEAHEVILDKAELYTQEQLLKMMKTIRKAVINEKCADYKFKNAYPWSELTITFMRAEGDDPKLTGVIKFELNRDTTDVSKLFAG